MRKITEWMALSAIIIIFAGLTFIKVPTIVEAQGGGSGPNFSLTFTIPASLTSTTIPHCSGTVTKNCIPNRNQSGHTVTYLYAPPAGQTGCGIVLNGSNDGTNWVTFSASGNIYNLPSGLFSGNEYFTYYELIASACPIAVTLSYTGFGSPVATEALSTPLSGNPFLVSAIQLIATWTTPAFYTGFQCSNPDATNPAYLQLIQKTSRRAPFPPAYTTIFSFMIPANQTVNFSGPALYYPAVNISRVDTKDFYVGASSNATNALAAATFNATPTAGGINYVQGDVGKVLTVTSCGATVAIAQVNSGTGTGPVTQIATTPTFAGSGCGTGTGLATTGGTGSGATVNLTAVAIFAAVSTPLVCNFEMNGTGPYYPFAPPPQF